MPLGNVSYNRYDYDAYGGVVSSIESMCRTLFQFELAVMA